MPIEEPQNKGYMDSLESSFNDASDNDRYTIITITHIVKLGVTKLWMKSKS
jgi:hypothetical protein